MVAASGSAGQVEFRVLGPFEAVCGSRPLPIGSRKQRCLLTMVALTPNRVVSLDQIIEALWAESPPVTATRTVHSLVSRLRATLSSSGGTATVELRTRDPGYLLACDPDRVDAFRFDGLWAVGREALAGGDPAKAALRYREALSLWRGAALADLAEFPFARVEAARLDQARLSVIEELAGAEWNRGRPGEVLDLVEPLIAGHPLRERGHGLLMLALYRLGRQADALAAYQRLRRILDTELGVEPSPWVRELEVQILRHAPHLTTPELPGALSLGVYADPPRGPVSIGAPAASESAGNPPVVGPVRSRLAAERTDNFVGRARERAVLDRAWARSAQGARQVVFLAGEPGIGKTRLAAEVADAAEKQGAQVLLGTCAEDLAVPYEPFVEALRELVNVLPSPELSDFLSGSGRDLTRLLPELAERSSSSSPHSADPETERYLMFAAVSDFLRASSHRRPLLLMLDDLQWATKPTVLLLRHLLRSPEPMSLMVVAAYRDSDVDRAHPLGELLADVQGDGTVARLTLGGLSDVESIALMEGLAGHGLEGATLETARAIYTETDGSPFFMGELIRHLTESGALVRQGMVWTVQGETPVLAIPDGVREVIGRRLSRLPAETARLLVLGSVIGREFEFDVLAVLTPMARLEVIDGLEQAARARLIREVPGSPGRFAFVHALIRNTLYEELGAARRMELHRAVAETLESRGGELSGLAHHWNAATPLFAFPAGDLAKAAAYAEAAGRRALASLAYEEAIHHIESALRSGEESKRCDRLILLGEAQRCAGDPAHRATLLEAGRWALAAGDADRAARAALANQRGVFSRMGAVDAERVVALEDALAAVGSAPTGLRAQLLASLATEVHFEGQDRRLELAQQALDVARRVGDADTLTKALMAVLLAGWGSSAAPDAGPMAAELDELADRLADQSLRFHAQAAVFYAAAGLADLTRARAALSICATLAERLSQPVLHWRVSLLEQNLAMATGRFADVEHWAAEAPRLGEEAGQPDALVYGRGSLTVTRILQGRAGEVEALLAPVIEQFPGALAYQGIQAWAWAELGRTDQARAAVSRLGSADGFDCVPRDHHRPQTLSMLGRACYRTGDVAAASQLYDLLVPFHSQMLNGQTTWLGPVAHDLGQLAAVLGRYDEAERHFVAAIEVQDRAGARGTVIHSRLGLARALLQRDLPGDSLVARRLLQEAKAGAREVDLPSLEATVEELLARTPV